jgi:rare lipoprotein A (peptidoglycan hydrolase)
MKFNLIIILFFFTIYSCAPYSKKNINKTTYTGSGFAYIYKEVDLINKITTKKFNTDQMEIGHKFLKIGTLLTITNHENNKFVTLKIKKKSDYPDFYKILLTEAVASKIGLNKKIPYVELFEIKKNKTFVAKKATTFYEEKKIKSAPITKVKIDNITINKKKPKGRSYKFSILIAEFYSRESAMNLKNKLTKELTNLNNKKLFVKNNKKNYRLYMGPYNAINVLKNDYIMLTNYGFEELEISTNE